MAIRSLRIAASLLLLATVCTPALAEPEGKELYDEVMASIGSYDDPVLAAEPR